VPWDVPKVGQEIGRVCQVTVENAEQVQRFSFEHIEEVARIAIRRCGFVHWFLNRGRSKGGKVKGFLLKNTKRWPWGRHMFGGDTHIVHTQSQANLKGEWCGSKGGREEGKGSLLLKHMALKEEVGGDAKEYTKFQAYTPSC
jgi:hypothetical protein